MAKSLVVEVVYLYEIECHALRVLKQTHTDLDFSEHNHHTPNQKNTFVANNKIILASVTYPSWLDHQGDKVLYVQGTAHNMNGAWIIIPENEFPAVRQAIEEYNKAHGSSNAIEERARTCVAPKRTSALIRRISKERT